LEQGLAEFELDDLRTGPGFEEGEMVTHHTNRVAHLVETGAISPEEGRNAGVYAPINALIGL
jgi:hypothetical protein